MVVHLLALSLSTCIMNTTQLTVSFFLFFSFFFFFSFLKYTQFGWDVNINVPAYIYLRFKHALLGIHSGIWAVSLGQ